MSHELARNRQQTDDEGRDVIHRLFERVYSKGDLRLVDELVASDCRGYSVEFADTYLGPRGMKTHVARLRRAFHGFTVDVDALHVAGDAIEVQWTARGIHERPFLDVEPTCNIGPAGVEPRGNRVVVTGSTSAILTNGAISEWVMEWDMEGFRQHLDGSAGQSKPAEGKSDARPTM